MKATTLHQPYASFMLALPPLKTIETRSRRILGDYTGPLAIHAAKREPAEIRERFLGDPNLRRLLLMMRGAGQWSADEVFDGLPRGRILGTVEVIRSAAAGDAGSLTLSGPERLLGDFGPGRTLIMTRNPRRLVTPIPWRGSQGVWRVEPDEVLTEAEYVTWL